MGIRKKIRLGFIAISLLLFFAGLISYLEVMRLDEITEKVVSAGAKSVVLSNEMLDIISHQDSAVVKFVLNKDTSLFIADSRMTLTKLTQVTKEVKDGFPLNNELVELIEKQSQFIEVFKYKEDSTDLNLDWYFTTYKAKYNGFVVTVKKFMRSTQDSVIQETSDLKNSAYRAIKQAIIALIVAIIIIVMFFALIDIYYIKPVVQITKGLKNYHNLKIPFNVTVNGRDEVFMLKEYIDQLMLKINAKNRSHGSINE